MELANVVDQRADVVAARLVDVKKMTLADVLRFYAAFKNEYDAIDTARKRLFEQVESLARQTIPEMMAEQDIKTITLDDIGYRFTVQQRFSCSMPDKDGGMIWLRANGLSNLIQETVNSSSLSSAAKAYIEEQGKDLPAHLFKASYMAVTSMTKVK